MSRFLSFGVLVVLFLFYQPVPADTEGCGIGNNTWIGGLLDHEGQFCTGTLVSDRHVLTAASCMDKYVPSDIKVRLGHQNFSVQKITKHDEFNEKNRMKNDIAVIHLTAPVAFRPICLPANFVAEGSTDGFLGWWNASILYEINMPVWTREDCDEAYPGVITKHLCAKFEEGRGEDSPVGAPLMIKSDGRWIIVGISSLHFGVPGKMHGIYTKVVDHEEWIHQYITRCGYTQGRRPRPTNEGERLADEGAWPWVAAILSKEKKHILCSGSLITSQHILTAAHCVQGRDTEELIVRLGAHKFDLEDAETRDFGVKTIYKRKVGKIKTDHGVAILQLEVEVKFSFRIINICLPTSDDNADGKNDAVKVWVSTSSNMTGLVIEAQLSISTIEDCKNFHEKDHGSTENYLCAGFIEKSNCKANIGEPLMIEKNGQWMLVGVSTQGSVCASPDKPDLYAKIEPYLFWIYQIQHCGIRSQLPGRVKRMVGGRPADKNEWPWMAAISEKRYTWIDCGGALISDQHILTRAHCVDYITADGLQVKLGEHDVSKNNIDRKVFDVEKIAKHEKFIRHTITNDIAILKLKTKVTVSDSIQPICLPLANFNVENKTAFSAGWGKLSGERKLDYSKVLQVIELPITTLEECQLSYLDLASKITITEKHLCAGTKEGGIGPCHADVGGPLMIEEDGRWTIVGVSSWSPCAAPNRFSGFMNVSAYLDWIEDQVTTL